MWNKRRGPAAAINPHGMPVGEDHKEVDLTREALGTHSQRHFYGVCSRRACDGQKHLARPVGQESCFSL